MCYVLNVLWNDDNAFYFILLFSLFLFVLYFIFCTQTTVITYDADVYSRISYPSECFYLLSSTSTSSY